MNRERLEITIDVLRQVEAARKPFDMSEWGSVHSCGTAACAFGYATLDPRLQAMGLYTICRMEDENDWIKVQTIEHFNEAVLDSISFCPAYNDACGYAAASQFYDISSDEAEHLFCPLFYPGESSNITSGDVIRRILLMLRNIT